MTYITRYALRQRIDRRLAANGQQLSYHNGEFYLLKNHFRTGRTIRNDDRALEEFARELGIHGVAVVPCRTCENCGVLPATTYEPDWDLSLCGECSRELHAKPLREDGRQPRVSDCGEERV
jgi:hypothetical protein